MPKKNSLVHPTYVDKKKGYYSTSHFFVILTTNPFCHVIMTSLRGHFQLRIVFSGYKSISQGKSSGPPASFQDICAPLSSPGKSVLEVPLMSSGFGHVEDM